MIFKRYEAYEPREIVAFAYQLATDGILTYSTFRLLLVIVFEICVYSTRGRTRKELAQDLKVKERQISRGLKELQEHGIIQRTARGNILIVTIYGYNNGETDEGNH